MKKILSVCLSIIILMLTLASCQKLCQHEYSNGVCEKCDLECIHSYTEGVCSICSQECAHSFNDGVCSICNQKCDHSFNDGVCSVCSKECEHSLKKGICSICNEIKLSADILENRMFEYSYFEFTWAPGTSDAQKEAFRKKYNVDTDEELFERYSDIFMKEWGWKITPDIIKYDFFSSENVYSTSKDNHGLTANYTVNSNLIKTQTKPKDTLYYEGEYIYSLKDSISIKINSDFLNVNETKKLDKEVVLKFVYIEK